MIDTKDSFLSVTERNSEQLRTMLEKLFAAAQPGAVYSEPVVAGNYTIVTASEVTAGGGFGSGMGFGPATTSSTGKQSGEEASQPEEANSGGGGFGAGGGSAGRPVAIIIIGPDGVTVKPVFDLTKIALAGVTVWGAMFTMLRRMRKAGKR